MTELKRERWNPFYTLLLIAGFVFVLTALAYAVVPVLEEKAAEAGTIPPPSPIRQSIREDGWKWLIGEGVAVALLSFLSMGYDKLRGKSD